MHSLPGTVLAESGNKGSWDRRKVRARSQAVCNYADNKMGFRHHKKENFSSLFLMNIDVKSPQQNTGKQNPAIYKNDSTSEIYLKNARLV